MKTKETINNNSIILDIDTESENIHINSVEFFNQNSYLDVSSMYIFKPYTPKA